MKKAVTVLGLVVFWLVGLWAFLFSMTVSRSNNFAVYADWFSGSKNCVDAYCNTTTLVSYVNYGWPIVIPGEATSGSYALAWGINIAVFALVAVLFGYLLVRKRKWGLIMGSILIVAIPAIMYLMPDTFYLNNYISAVSVSSL